METNKHLTLVDNITEVLTEAAEVDNVIKAKLVKANTRINQSLKDLINLGNKNDFNASEMQVLNKAIHALNFAGKEIIELMNKLSESDNNNMNFR